MVYLKKKGFFCFLYFVLLFNFVFIKPEKITDFKCLLNDFSLAFNQSFGGHNFLLVDDSDFEESFELTMQNLKETAGIFSEDELYFIQKVVVPSDSRVLVVGDIHADFYTVKSLLNLWVKNDVFSEETFNVVDSSESKMFPGGFVFSELLETSLKLQDNVTVIFLGDYFDRGGSDFGVLSVMMKLKIDNPNNCFFIKGNHELDSYCHRSLSISMSLSLLLSNFVEFITKNIFQFFPSAILLGVEGAERKMLLTHGTIPLSKSVMMNDEFYSLFRNFNESDRRFMSISKNRANMFAWSDIIEADGSKGSIRSSFRDNFQDSIFVIEEWVVFDFLKRNNLYGVISGHSHIDPLRQIANNPLLSIEDIFCGAYESMGEPGVYFKRSGEKFIIKHIAGPLYDGKLGYTPSYLEFRDGVFCKPFIVFDGCCD